MNTETTIELGVTNNLEDDIISKVLKHSDECEQTLILGNTGTGKSLTVHRMLSRMAESNPSEAVIIYDPSSEFVSRHYRPQRGDIILNPFDARSPYWSPSKVVRHTIDGQMILESFFPGN